MKSIDTNTEISTFNPNKIYMLSFLKEKEKNAFLSQKYHLYKVGRKGPYNVIYRQNY